MSTVLYCLLAVIAIINCQTFEDCGSQSITVGSNANQETLIIQLERDLINEEVRITLTGPSDKWFGFVIGQGTMGGGYGIYGSGSSTNYALTEKSLLYQSGGGNALSLSGTDTATLGSNNGVLTLVRPLSVSGNYYDFTNLLGATCNGDSMAFGGVIGSSLSYKKHTFETKDQVFTSTCSCPTDPPTTDPTYNPTYNPTNDPTYDPSYDPTIDPTIQPTGDTTDPTNDPTMDPTMDPTNDPTKEGQTRDPTIDPTHDPTVDPTSDPTANPITISTTSIDSTTMTTNQQIMSSMSSTDIMTTILTTENDGYEQCATAELIDGYKLNIYRNIQENMVGIMMSGPNNVWFGYGFGSPVMTDAYGVTVEGTDSTSLVIVERTLDKNSSPGTTLDASGEAQVIINDSSVEAYLMRPYAAANDGFDFTEFMKCNVESIDLIAAIGDIDESGTSMGYHGDRVKEQTLQRLSTCICDDDTDTDDITSTTKLPDDGGSADNIFNVFNIMAIVSVCVYGII